MKNILILLMSLSIIYGQGMAINSDGSITRVPEEPSMATDIVIAGGIVFVYFVIMIETMNCLQPHYIGNHENMGFVCEWPKETFYLEDGKYVLHKKDSEDNWIERKIRKRYWKKRSD